MAVTSVEQAAMRRAIVLSALGLGVTSPDPPVGCVILDSRGRAVGEGYHARQGDPHAELQALQAAGERADGGTAVVTLEPCDHPERTPPCHWAIIESGISRVLVALLDHTRGDGSAGGVARLRQAGLSVVTNVLAPEARLVLSSWFTALDQRRPFVSWVYAVPADGLACTLPAAAAYPFREASADAQQLRTVHDVVLCDDGELFAHSPAGHLIDFSEIDACGEPALVLSMLFARGVRSLLLDGSLSLASPFLAAGLVDQAIAYVAAGSPSTVPLVTAAGLVANFALHDVRRLSSAVRVHSRPVPPLTRSRTLAARDPLSGGWSVRADWATPPPTEQ